MKQKAHGQVRRSQVITTYGPGALIDLPQESAIVAGLDEWPPLHKLEEVDEPRLARKLRAITGVAVPRMVAPPPVSSDPGATPVGIGAWRFPEWFVVQEAEPGDGHIRARRLVHRKALDDHRRFEGRPVVATRFVRACPRGHVDDVDWRRFVHRPGSDCPPTRPLWLDEQGTTGDLADLLVRCECGASRRLSDASMREHTPLGTCSGARPWLGRGANENSSLPSRLLVRTASNAWFPQVVSVLSLPERGSAVETAVRELWDDLQIVDDAADLAFIKKKPKVAAALAAFTDDEIHAAIHAAKGATPGTDREGDRARGAARHPRGLRRWSLSPDVAAYICAGIRIDAYQMEPLSDETRSRRRGPVSCSGWRLNRIGRQGSSSTVCGGSIPGTFVPGQLRTLQRRVKDWRRLAARRLVFADPIAPPREAGASPSTAAVTPTLDANRPRRVSIKRPA